MEENDQREFSDSTAMPKAEYGLYVSSGVGLDKVNWAFFCAYKQIRCQTVIQ